MRVDIHNCHMCEHNGTHTLELWITWLFDLPLHQLGIPSLRRVPPPVAQSLQLGAPSAWSPVQPGRVEQTCLEAPKTSDLTLFFRSESSAFSIHVWWSFSFGGVGSQGCWGSSPLHTPAVPWGSPWCTNPSMASGWGVPIWALERHQFSLVDFIVPHWTKGLPGSNDIINLLPWRETSNGRLSRFL